MLNQQTTIKADFAHFLIARPVFFTIKQKHHDNGQLFKDAACQLTH